ncbi:response regulator [candidate division KSB1 bacterium]|nr:response regulator [candidate division KSB1 bacterium]
MSKRILVIEDDENLQLIARHILTNAGFDVISAMTGEEGLEKLLSKKPDLVILDNMMPRKSGEQVFDEVMDDPKYRSVGKIPFIMLTAKEMKREKIRDFLERGMAAFLSKPFGPKELLNVIQNILTTHEIQVKEQHLFKVISKAKDFLKNLVNTIPDALFIVDKDGKINFYNGGHVEVLQYQISDLVGQTFDSITSKDSPSLSELIKLLDDKDKLCNVSLNLKDQNNNLVPFSFSLAKLYNQQDEMIGIIFIGSDISEIKRLERELVEKEKLAIFSETAIAINHEINNPLAPIIGNVQLLLEDKMLEGSAQKKLKVIFRNAVRIKEITQKLRDIRQPVQTSYLGDTKMVDLSDSN